MRTRLAVTGVKIKGAQRTRIDFLEKLLRPVVSTGGDFAGVIEDVHDAVERLRSTGVFSGADAYLDITSETTADAVFTVSEKSLYRVHTGTSVRANAERDAGIEASLVWRNVTGRADTLKASASAGAPGSDFGRMFGEKEMKIDRGLCADYIAPFVYGLRNDLYAHVERYERAWNECKFRERTKEAIVGITNDTLGSVESVLAWREVCEIEEGASLLMRDEAGHSLKNSIRHRWMHDRRDHPSVPTEGWKVGTVTEIAGLFGGDAKFRKCVADAQLHLPAGMSGVSLALTGRAGVVSGTPGVLDRLFLGGPNDLRGFDYRGVGPRESNTALGGQAFYTLGAWASIPAPRNSALAQLFMARFHAFGLIGDMGEVEDVSKVGAMLRGGPKAWKQMGQSMRDSARICVGVGLAAATAFGRIEVNWCHVLEKATADLGSTGVQFGLSREFL